MAPPLTDLAALRTALREDLRQLLLQQEQRLCAAVADAVAATTQTTTTAAATITTAAQQEQRLRAVVADAVAATTQTTTTTTQTTTTTAATITTAAQQEQRFRAVVADTVVAAGGPLAVAEAVAAARGAAAPEPSKSLSAPEPTKSALECGEPSPKPKDIDDWKVEDLYSNIEPPAWGANSDSGCTKLKFGGCEATRKMQEERKLRDLDKKAYNVMNQYYEKGIIQRIARSDRFNNFTLFVITANAVYLGINSEHNSDSESILDSPLIFALTENVFCVYFTFEILVRFGAFKHKLDSLRDNWFRFDACLVILMVLETWVLPGIMLSTGVSLAGVNTAPLRLLRLLRLSRLVRIARSLPELVTMTKGMVVASRAVMSSLLMILMLIYVMAIVIHMLLRHHPELPHKFATLPKCMWTLFMDGTFLAETSDVLTLLLYEWTPSSLVAVFVFLVFILLSAMTVMNMLIGVLCEVVSTVAADERDEAAIALMKETVLLELLKFDENGDGTISRLEFAAAMSNHDCLSVLDHLQVDLDCLGDLQMVIFPDDTSDVAIEEVMETLLQYRGDIPPTVRHLVDMMSFTRWYLAAGMRVLHDRMEHRLRDLHVQQRDGLRALSLMCEEALSRNSSVVSPTKPPPPFLRAQVRACL